VLVTGPGGKPGPIPESLAGLPKAATALPHTLSVRNNDPIATRSKNMSQDVTLTYIILSIIVIGVLVSLPGLFKSKNGLTDLLITFFISLMLALTALMGLAIYMASPAIVFKSFGAFSWVFLIHLQNSLIVYILYAYDKGIAIFNGEKDDQGHSTKPNAKKRIPEKLLHLGELIGGWPGGWLARFTLRHKTNWKNKTAFKLGNWLIILLHLGFWTWYIFIR
jgi:uncharacterized membrane protein YsdA (DUF1294 family)